MVSPFRQGFNAYVSRPRFTYTRPPVIPFESYRVRRSGVPLQGGQAQGTIGSSASGSASSPAALQGLAGIPLPAGTYKVTWSVTLAGTVGAGDANNFEVTRAAGAVVLATSVNAGAAGTYPQASFTFTITAPDTVVLKVGASAPTAGSVYSGSMSMPTLLTLQIGPQGAGTVWYPAQVTTFTTSGVNDTSTCLIYMGAAGTPVTLMGTLFPGGAGVLAVAFPPLTVGLFIIAQFSNGNVGDVAAVNVTGTMDYLDTVTR